MSLLPFLKRFPDDEACWAHLKSVRWPNGPVCPHCGAVDEAHSAGRAHDLRCNACNGKFRVSHGTPFEGTHLPLQNWFTASISGPQRARAFPKVKLAEHLGIGQKTAWFLGRRIRRMMEDNDDLLGGIVAVDETYLGGKQRKKGQKSRVTVAAERGGRVKAEKGKTHSERTI